MNSPPPTLKSVHFGENNVSFDVWNGEQFITVSVFPSHRSTDECVMISDGDDANPEILYFGGFLPNNAAEFLLEYVYEHYYSSGE